MAKSTKKNHPPKSHQNQPKTETQQLQQKQSIDPKKEKAVNKNKPPKLVKILFGLACCFLIVFVILMFNSLADHVMTSNTIKNALAHEYVYVNYVEYKMTFFSGLFFVSFIILAIIYYIYLYFSEFNDINGIVGMILMPILPFIPVMFFCIFHYHNVDKFMYHHIKNLYQLVSKDPKFEQTDISINLRKALNEKDYATLKVISSDINAFAKVTPEQLNVIEEAVSKLPLYKIRSEFDTFREGYTSYAEYKKFYRKAKDLFKKSEYKNNPKYMAEMKQLKIMGYDYDPIKTIID